MAIVRDCGDFEAKIGFSVGISFVPPIDEAKQKEITSKFEKLQDELQRKRERMELELLDWICEQVGYPEEVVAQLVTSRETETQRATTAETEGRATKHERRRKARV